MAKFPLGTPGGGSLIPISASLASVCTPAAALKRLPLAGKAMRLYVWWGGGEGGRGKSKQGAMKGWGMRKGSEGLAFLPRNEALAKEDGAQGGRHGLGCRLLFLCCVDGKS